ncbi:MAG TPA: 30S ribosomal protein THX [Bacteroidales bacterium]|nr:30S ribosomal protein THX [Bacteroidales bacterium]
MGKGDKKSRKGKIWIGSYGVRRLKKKTKLNKAEPDVKKEKKNDIIEQIAEPVVAIEEKPQKTKKELASKNTEEEISVPKVKKTSPKKKEPKIETDVVEGVAEKPKSKKTTKKD